MSATPSLIRAAVTHLRRNTTKFAVTSHLEYTVGRIHGEGVTVSIGSDDIIVKTDRPLPVGRKIRLCIDWPTVLNDGSVSIAVTGRIVRSTTDRTAVKVSDYKCQIQPRFFQSAAD
jgi:hypothetical protein